jgi:hypothetical protein
VAPEPEACTVRPLDSRERAALAALVLLGVALRVWIALRNYGVAYDTDTATIVAHLLVTHPLHAYASERYPYPPGYFPLLLAGHWVSTATGLAFWKVWKLPAVAGDVGIIFALVWGLGRLGADAATRLGAAAVVALGPIFVLVSGYHGQLDPVAILPALVAVVIWQTGGSRRAVSAGLLIGLGAAVKTVPFFVVLALLPTARSRREGAIVLIGAAAVPVLSSLPFLLADPDATWHSLQLNRGVAGLGGLSVLAQPSLVHDWLAGRVPHPSATTVFLTAKQNLFVAAGVMIAAAGGWWRRLDAVWAATLIWLAVYITNVNWSYQYFVWGLPFFLLARRIREAIILQLLLLIPALEIYLRIDVGVMRAAVIPLSLLTWALLALAFPFALRREVPA